MTRRWLPAAVIAVAALGGACSDTTTLGATELNLDRPVDVSFACYGQMRKTDGTIDTTAMPAAVCQSLSPPQTTFMKDKDGNLVKDKDGNPIPVTTPFPGQEDLPVKPNAADLFCAQNPCWYGFILQSASGTVALAQWPSVPADAMFPTNQQPQQFSDTPSSLFRVLDADPLTPGKNALSIGEDPVALGTDKSGCFEITANAGSCDLSEIDITSALSNIVDGNPARPQIDRVPVFVVDGTMNDDGTPHSRKLLSKPSAMIVEPFRDDLDTVNVGKACPKTPTSKLYIAYPSCQLVAEVELGAGADGRATANVIGGIHFDGNGTASVLTTPQDLASMVSHCPTECPPDPGMPVVSVTPGLRPVALDYRLDPRKDTSDFKPEITSKLAIGADIRATPLAAPVTVVDLDLATFAPLSAKLLPIPLEGNGGPVGVSALALSAQIGMGGDANVLSVDDRTNDQAQYVYAVATDGTVRVADVLKLKRECDTQIDGRFVRKLGPTTNGANPLECLPLGQPDLPRRPGARSPGIELPGGAVANSVAIIKGLTKPPTYTLTQNMVTTTPTMLPQPALLLGYFAIITASTGEVFVANVDDDYVPDNLNPSKEHALQTSPVLVMAHQLRDSVGDREDVPGKNDVMTPKSKICTSGVDGTAGANAGGPRLTAAPTQQSAPTTLFADLDVQLPRVQQVACDQDLTLSVTALDFGAPEVQTDTTPGPAVARDTAYPDLRSVVGENWTLTYEGTLELDTTVNSTNGPSLHFGQTFVDRNGMFIEDAAQPFCHMGVEPSDVVEFQGCDPAHVDADCPSGYTCYLHPASTLKIGACFLKSEAPRLQDVCRDFLSSIRRYTVGTDSNGGTAPGKLVLWERKHELSTTPVDGCVSDDQCDDLARAAFVINQSADPFVEAAAGTPVEQRTTHWSCMADPLRKAINTDPARNKRCVQVCDPAPPDPKKPPHPVCAGGMVCVPEATSVVGGVCMEGIEPPQVCLNGPQRYVVRAGEAFTVVGDHTGFVHPIITSPDGKSCMRDPKLDRDPLSIGRIPLTSPPCGPAPTDPVLASEYPFTGRITSSTFEANPCSLTVKQFDFKWVYPAPSDPGVYGSCHSPVMFQPDPKVDPTREFADFPAIKFRNRALTLTLVDPYRQADQSCLGRNPGNVPTNIPLVVPGYQIAFAVKAGFSPLTLSRVGHRVSPVKVVRGPSESIWVVDDGDFVGNGITDVTTRGQVFRIESVPAPPGTNPSAQLIVNTME